MISPDKVITLSHPKYRPDIDGLRALAVLSVIGFHAFPDYIVGGFIGVDVFFVISGYLISTIIFKNFDSYSFSFVEFYARRVNRIFPALILVLTACYVIGWFTLLAGEYKQLGKHIFGGSVFISNLFFWDESSYFDNLADTKPLLHLWSLGIEEQFYIFWPIILFISWKSKLNFFSIAIVMAIISFYLNIHYVTDSPVATFYSPITRFWELLSGSILAWLKVKNELDLNGKKTVTLDHIRISVIHKNIFFISNELLRNIQSVLSISLLGFAIFYINKAWSFPGWGALLPVIGTVMLINAGQFAWINKSLLSQRFIVGIGLISFPLYLWHWPLLSFARILEGETPSIQIRLVAVIISVVLAWLTYRFIERPIRFSKGKHKTGILIFLMSLVGYLGFNIYDRDGLDFRQAEKAASINKFDYPYRNNCEQFSGEKQEFGQDWCSSDDFIEINPTTILIGDSFSNAYTTVLDAYKKNSETNLRYIQLGRALCPFLTDYGPPYCQSITKKAHDYIIKSKEIKTVIIAIYWPFYYNLGGNSWPNIFHLEGQGKLEAAFEKTIDDYKSHGKKVVVFLPPPTGIDPKACIARVYKLSDKNVCNLTRLLADKNDGKFREYLITKLHTKNIGFFDPFAYMCDDNICKISESNKIFYADGQHLSVFGGDYLANSGKEKLDTLLRSIN
jgi:peptidoglycan/LPS O-acetylase OafA/YrhL